MVILHTGHELCSLRPFDPIYSLDPSTQSATTLKQKAASLRLRVDSDLNVDETKDINELELPKTCKTEFPDPDDLLNFKLIIQPDEGFYRGGKFSFSFKIGQNYPHEPPKVKCMNKVCSFLFLGRVPSV